MVWKTFLYMHPKTRLRAKAMRQMAKKPAAARYVPKRKASMPQVRQHAMKMPEVRAIRQGTVF